MSARDVIARAIEQPPIEADTAGMIVAALHAAGYRILGPDDIDPVTLERCARVADESRSYHGWISQSTQAGEAAEKIAATIRSLGEGR